MLPVRTCFLALGLLALLVGAHGRFLLQGKDDGDVSKDKNEDKAVIEVEAEENVTMLSGEGDENATAFANGAGMNLTALEGKNMTVPAEDGKNATALGDKAEKNMTVIEGEKGGNVTTEGVKADANVTNLGMDQEESMTSVEKKEKRDKKVPKEADKKMTALQMEESDNVTVVLVLPEETDGDAESLPERKNETMTAEVAEEDGEKQKRNVTIVLVPKMEEKNDNTKKLGEKVAEPSMDEDGKSANGSAVPMDEDIDMTSTVVEEGKNATVQDSDDVQYEDGEQDAAVILPAPGDKVEDTEDVAEEEDKATVVQEDEDEEEQLLVQNGGKNAKNGPTDEENNMSALQKDDGKKELTAGEEKNTTSVPAEKESMATAILPEEEDNGATVGAENGDNVTDSVLVLGENLTMVVVNSKENATSLSEAEEKLVPTRSFKDEDTFRKEKEEKKVADTTRGGDSKVATVEKEANGMANVVSEDEDEEKDRTDASNGDGVEDIEAVEEDSAPEAGTNEKGNSTNLATEEQEDPTQEEDATTGLAKVQVFNMLEESTTVEISFRIGRLTYGGTLELSPGLRELVEILPETEDIVLEFPDCGSAVRTYKDTSELVGPEGIISIIIDEDCVDSLR